MCQCVHSIVRERRPRVVGLVVAARAGNRCRGVVVVVLCPDGAAAVVVQLHVARAVDAALVREGLQPCQVGCVRCRSDATARRHAEEPLHHAEAQCKIFRHAAHVRLPGVGIHDCVATKPQVAGPTDARVVRRAQERTGILGLHEDDDDACVGALQVVDLGGKLALVVAHRD
eukprot:7391455-Prymnesium_polylepis.4